MSTLYLKLVVLIISFNITVNMILFQLGDKANDNKQTELFPTSSAKAADPCILLITDTHFALCRENQTVLVNTSGETENKSLKWSEAPVFLAHDPPYTLGVLTDSIEASIKISSCFKLI